MTIVVSKRDLNSIVDALIEAVEHLDYCGYGDAWERTVLEGGIDKRLNTAVGLGNRMVGKS